ncbi:alpha/beta hydrolase-like protein [Lophium mytilinum]|uniref:Alpha/beta hydrolase-like protein n=1 Tax=Lophium mytilinum TaxID=390894 RepID=A0A6A6RG44_9PEZI|nr:alpha/beta hydrolase-like protein [Lophium mytilinum]
MAAAPLTAEQLVHHPEFKHISWPLQPAAKGKVSVAAGRGGPFSIAYEIHGKGDRRLVWIMGLGGLKTTWQRQTKDFAHTKGDIYTSLVFDNRGIGESDKPFMRYSTSEMAKDTVELLDHVGWTDNRRLHVIGISMGGMIAQELALLIPDRICSLSLVSTASGLFNTVGYFENLRNRINLFIPRAIDVQLNNVKRNMYTAAWLEKPDDTEYVVEPFPTNGDRFAAFEIAKRSNAAAFSRTGFLAQAIAAGWHYKSPAQLKSISEKLGKKRIMIVHGGSDRMIPFPHAKVLQLGLEGWDSLEAAKETEAEIETHFPVDQSHVIPIEMRATFMEWVEGLVEKTEKLDMT